MAASPAPATAARATRDGRGLRAALARLARRPRRLSLAGLAPSVAALIVLAWSLSGAILILVAVPGLLESIFSWTIDAPTPGWLRVLVLTAAAVVAAGALVATVLRDAREPSGLARRLGRAVVTAATGLAVGGLLLASDAVVPAIAAAVGAVLGVVVLHARTPLGVQLVLTAVAGSIPWLAAAAAQLVPPDAGFLGWLWIVTLPLAGGFAAFGALYGVARGAESRVGGLHPLLRREPRAAVAALVLAGALAVVALRYTALSGIFGELDGLLWRLAPSLSWIHAALVAVAITAVVVRSTRRPLRRVGRRVATAVFGVAAAIQLVFLGPLVLVLAVTAILLGSGVDLSDVVLAVAPWLSVALVVSLALAVAHPVFAGSAGRWMTWVGAFFVLPGAVASAAGPAFDAVPSFWAKPPQVVALVVVAAGILLVAGLVRPAFAVPRRTILRLALVPLVAVHATALLPAPWESLLGRAVLVVGVVLGTLLLAPPRSSDPLVRGRRLLTRTTAQLAGLVVFVLALPSVLSTETFGIVGTLWLAIPVAIGLSVTVVPRGDTAPAGVPEVLVDDAEVSSVEQ